MDQVESSNVSYNDVRNVMNNQEEYPQLSMRRRKRHDPTMSNKRVSPLWAHFEDDGKRASCLYCDSKLIHHSSTTPLKNHLLAKHPQKLPVNIQLQTRVRLKSTKESFERDFIKVFIKNLKSLSEVNDLFVKYLLPLCGIYEDSIKQNLRQQLENLYNSYDLKLKKLIEEECVGLTLAIEIWNSQKYSYHQYMCVTGHFLTSSFKTMALLLGVVHLNTLNEDEVALQIKQILETHNLNICSVAAIVAPLGWVQWEKICLALNVPYCKCLTSILHNVIQTGLLEYNDFLVRVRQFISGLRCNPNTWKQLLTMNLSHNEHSFHLTLDHPDRLLSTYDMLLDLFKWQNFLEPMSSFSKKDWSTCHTLISFLSSFKELSVELNSEKYLNASSTTTTLFGWLRSLTHPSNVGKVQELYESTVETFQSLRPIKFDSLYIFATILDPRWKHLPFWQSEHSEKAREEFKNYVNSIIPYSYEKQNELQNELMMYYAESRLDPETNPLDWWVEKQSTYPNISLIARRLLAIPDSATSSLAILRKRSLLGPNSVVHLYTLNRNMETIDAYLSSQKKSSYMGDEEDDEEDFGVCMSREKQKN